LSKCIFTLSASGKRERTVLTRESAHIYTHRSTCENFAFQKRSRLLWHRNRLFSVKFPLLFLVLTYILQTHVKTSRCLLWNYVSHRGRFIQYWKFIWMQLSYLH